MQAAGGQSEEDQEEPSSTFRVFGREGEEPLYFAEAGEVAPAHAQHEEASPSSQEHEELLEALDAFEAHAHSDTQSDAHTLDVVDDPFAVYDDAAEQRSETAFDTSSAQTVDPAFDDAPAQAPEPTFTEPAPISASIEVTAPLADPTQTASPWAQATALVTPDATANVTAANNNGRPDWNRDPAFWAHLLPIAGSVLVLTGFGLVPPLLIENTSGKHDEFVRQQARESLNFQLNLALVNIAALITFTGPLVWPIVLVFGIVLPIQAALDVRKGNRHRYPLVPRWID